MEVNNNSCLRITPQKLLASRSLQLFNNLPRRRAHNQLIFILEIHVYRQHVPAEQLLAIRSIKPKRLNLSLFTISSAL